MRGQGDYYTMLIQNKIIGLLLETMSFNCKYTNSVTLYKMIFKNLFHYKCYLLNRWLGIFLMMKMAYSIHHHRTWHDEEPRFVL